MKKIITRRGREYCYSSYTNRISLWNSESGFNFDAKSDVSFYASNDYRFDKVSLFVIEITQQCNLRCRYCCYSGSYESRRVHNDCDISWKILRNCVNFIEAHADLDEPYITICFYGGEALLARQKITWLISELTKNTDIKFHFSISTNGVLLTDDVIDWICSIPNLKLTVTLDGDKVLHDRNRVTKSGSGSYDVIMHNLRRFKEYHPKEYEERLVFLSTICSIFDLERLSNYWQSDPVIANKRPVRISQVMANFSKGEKISLKETDLISVYDKALKMYLSGEENILTDELKRLANVIERREFFKLPEAQKFITCCHAPYSCFITAQGELYICERFCQNLDVGNIETGFDQSKCNDLVERFTERKNLYCSGCWAKRLCRICATNLNYSDEELKQMCQAERRSLELALRYYCEIQEYAHTVQCKQ